MLLSFVYLCILPFYLSPILCPKAQPVGKASVSSPALWLIVLVGQWGSLWEESEASGQNYIFLAPSLCHYIPSTLKWRHGSCLEAFPLYPTLSVTNPLRIFPSLLFLWCFFFFFPINLWFSLFLLKSFLSNYALSFALGKSWNYKRKGTKSLALLFENKVAH